MSNINKHRVEIVERTGGSVTTTEISGNWSRWPEVVGYASRNGISVDEAIRQLVNSGLSHQRAVFL